MSNLPNADWRPGAAGAGPQEHARETARASPSRCRTCADATSRRQFFGQISVALLAAMIGAEAHPATAGTVSVTSAGGVQTGPDEHAYPVPASDGVTIDRDQQVILVRYKQHVYAFALACPHENTALRWRQQDGRFQCPRHESKYQPDGTFTSGRATRNMDRFAIRRAGDTVVVDLSRFYRSDKQPDEWAAASVTVAG